MDGTGLMQPESKAKVDVLLKEYDSLRQEAIHRLNNRFHMLGYAGAIITYTAVQSEGVTDARLLCGVGAALNH